MPLARMGQTRVRTLWRGCAAHWCVGRHNQSIYGTFTLGSIIAIICAGVGTLFLVERLAFFWADAAGM